MNSDRHWALGDPPLPPNAQECVKRLRALARWYRAGTSTLMTGSDMVVFDCAADELERAELNLRAADTALAETQARYEKDIRALNARLGGVIDARNTFVAGACTAEQLCDKIDAAIFGYSLSQPNPPSFHPNLVAFAPEEI
jgi:hypothetical protein